MEPESYPTKLKRDLRASSPQPLFRALADLLEESGFQVRPKRTPELEAGALPGTATFRGRLLGVLDFTEGSGSRGRGLRLAGAGVAVVAVMAGLLVGAPALDIVFPILGMVAGAVLLATGLGRLRETSQRLRRLVDIHLEGESYQAGATRGSPAGGEPSGLDLRVERSGVVSDVRITVYAGVGHPEGDEGVSRWLPRRDEAVLSLVSEVAGQPARNTAPSEGKALEAGKSGLPARRLDHQLDVIADRFTLAERDE